MSERIEFGDKDRELTGLKSIDIGDAPTVAATLYKQHHDLSVNLVTDYVNGNDVRYEEVLATARLAAAMRTLAETVTEKAVEATQPGLDNEISELLGEAPENPEA